MKSARMMAVRASESPAFLANQVIMSMPKRAEPYSLAGNVPPASNVIPKTENKARGISNKAIPSTRKKSAFNAISVLKLMIEPPLIEMRRIQRGIRRSKLQDQVAVRYGGLTAPETSC